jgi:hypothetical protein
VRISGIERRERLVHQEDRRIGGEGAREADALLHAAGQLRDALFGPVAEVDDAEDLARAAEALGAGLAGEFEAEGDVLDHAAPGQERELLEHHRHRAAAQRAQIAGAQLATSVTPRRRAHQHPAARHLVEAVDRAQQRGLARAGEAHQHRDLALGHGQRAVVHAEDLAGRFWISGG